MKLEFKETALHTMHDALTRHYPEEACGFLVGYEYEEGRIIEEAWPAKNISTENRGRRFIVDPLDYLKAEKDSARKGYLLLGIYHSHPDHPAVPSEHDLAAAHPFFSYTIVSIARGSVADTRSYQLIDGQFIEETIHSLITES